MPFYDNLQVKPSDLAAQREKKLRTAAGIRKLKEALSTELGSSGKSDKSVRIATWNLREFGAGKYKGRDFECLYYIAEIISHFDIVALQEVRGDMMEFEGLRKILGYDWDYIASDVTDGNAGNGERMVFLYHKPRVRFTNVVGELTLAEGQKIKAAFGERILLENGLRLILPQGTDLSGIYDAGLQTTGDKVKLREDLEIEVPQGSMLELPPNSKVVLTKNSVVQSPGRGKAEVRLPNQIEGPALRLRFPENSFDDSLRQFARTPYLISFQAGWLQLNLCTVHIYYGSDDAAKMEQRRSEIEQLTRALAAKAKSEYEHNPESFLGVLGDFNILGKDHPTMAALESNDFIIPQELKQIPGSNVARDKAYDQIAFWKPDKVKKYARLDVRNAGIFDFYEHVFREDQKAIYLAEGPQNGLKSEGAFKDWRTYKMSDHLPMWIELRSDFTEEYLTGIENSGSI